MLPAFFADNPVKLTGKVIGAFAVVLVAFVAKVVAEIALPLLGTSMVRLILKTVLAGNGVASEKVK